MTRPWLVLTEGKLEVAAVRRLLAEVGSDLVGCTPIVAGSRAGFWDKAKRFNAAAKRPGFGVVVGLVDQENPNVCAPKLLQEKLGGDKAQTFVLRIAERMLEDWILADTESLSKFLSVPARVVEVAAAKTLVHPKTRIVNLARRCRSRSLQSDLLPEQGSQGLVGPGYTTRMEQFLSDHWNPRQAAPRSESLNRALAELEAILS